MITIDMIDESKSRSEKPVYRMPEYGLRAENRNYDPIQLAAHNHHEKLLRAAQDARVLKAAKINGLALEVQRFVE